MAVSLEVWLPSINKWGMIHEITPDTSPSVMRQILPDGQRKAYVVKLDDPPGHASINGYPLKDHEAYLQEADFDKKDPDSSVILNPGQSHVLAIKETEDCPRYLFKFTQQ